MTSPAPFSRQLAALLPIRMRRASALTIVLLFAVFVMVTAYLGRRESSMGVEVAYDSAQQAWIVTGVNSISAAGAAGVHTGDRIVSLNDAPVQVHDIRDLTHANKLTVQRPQTDRLITADRAEGQSHWPFYFISALFCLVGVGTLAFGNGPAPRALALLCCTGTFVIANLPFGFRGATWALVLNSLILPLFIGSFAYLFLCFPINRRLAIGRRQFRAEWILAPALVVSLGYLLVYIAPGDATEWFRQLTMPPYYFVCLLIGIGALARSWWQTETQRERKQLRIIAIGSTLAVLPFLLLTLPGNTIGQQPLLAPQFSALPLCLIPISFGYAILRYQVMDLNLYVRRGVLYSIFAGIVAAIYGVILVAATVLASAWTEFNNAIALAIIAVFLAVAGDRLRARLTRVVDRLFDRRRYDYRQQLLDFSQQMSTIEDPDELAQTTITRIRQTMGAGRVRFYLYDAAREVYHLWVWDGGEPAEEDKLLGTRHAMVLDAQRARGGFAQQLEAPADIDALVLPLQHRGQPIALLALGRKDSELPYSSEDLALLRTVANQLAVATENAQLYGRMRDLYLSGVRTLAATVDAKDSYTHGHSERVASYSRAIAVALGLPQIEVETIELAGLLHDLGKIGVPDAVLQKPGRLDRDERELIERHADLGARILADNPALAPLVPLVRHHHERFDGKGYPSGLAGEDIPLGAAIICAADTYDTMTTDRPYRRAPGHAQAREELVRCSGAQFDPRVIRAFVRAVESAEWRNTAARSGMQQQQGSQLAARLAGANTRAMSIVYQIAQTIGDVTDLASFTMRVAELLRREWGTRAVEIFLVDEVSGDYYQIAPAAGHDGLRVPAGQGLIGWVAQQQRPALVADARGDERISPAEGWDGLSGVAVPLISQGFTFGVISIQSPRTGAFTEEDETVLEMVARQLAQVLEVARLHDQVKRTATQDGLTGIANYRAFYGTLEAALERSALDGSSVALMLIDLDGLKQLNDTHGHLAGDGAIRAIAQALHRASRPGELVARYGGDEFAVVLAGLEEAAAKRRAKELAQAVRDAGTFEFDQLQLPLPNISYGVSICGIDGDRTLSLVAAADARMYTQKLSHYAAVQAPALGTGDGYDRRRGGLLDRPAEDWEGEHSPDPLLRDLPR